MMPAHHEPRCTGCGLHTSEVDTSTRCAECERVVCGTCKRGNEGEELCPPCLLATPKTVVHGGRRSGVTGAHSRAASVASTTSPLDEREEDHGWSEGRGHY